MLRELLNDISFEWPWAFTLVGLIPLLVKFQFFSEKDKPSTLKVSNLTGALSLTNIKTRLRFLPKILRIAGLFFLIVCIAKPYRLQVLELNSGKGLEIVLCLDVSGSMLARDFSPNRLEASQSVAKEFIQRRKGDKIGLVVFSGQSLTACPITTDHNALLYQLEAVNYGILSDGTSIGSGLASAVNALGQGNVTSKIVVLLTDGEDTGGKMDPVTAMEIARTYGVKVYTIGVGTEGYTNIPYQTNTGNTVLEREKVSIDEPLLISIASKTGGQYFRATNKSTLEKIYSAIDGLEKSDIQTTHFNKRKDAFFPFLIAAALFLFAEWLLQYTWLRKFP